MNGRINLAETNVYSSPDTSAKTLGTLALGERIKVFCDENDWLKFQYYDNLAFVNKSAVDLEYAKVITDLEDAFAEPTEESEKVTRLEKGRTFCFFESGNDWLRIIIKSRAAFIRKQNVMIVNFDNAPSKQLKGGSEVEILAADVWNKYGNMLTRKSDSYGIQVGTTIAIICVESSGLGFSKDGKCIIRFENHVFYKIWGSSNESIFNNYFMFDKSEPWLGHKYRSSELHNWKAQHKSQVDEWDSFGLAYSLNANAALSSISMGAPQIMGFNHSIIGYTSPQEMFEKFKEDIKYQFMGLFDFCVSSPSNLECMKNNDFLGIAKFYNGNGKAKHYSTQISKYYNAFSALI